MTPRLASMRFLQFKEPWKVAQYGPCKSFELAFLILMLANIVLPPKSCVHHLYRFFILLEFPSRCSIMFYLISGAFISNLKPQVAETWNWFLFLLLAVCLTDAGNSAATQERCQDQAVLELVPSLGWSFCTRPCSCELICGNSSSKREWLECWVWRNSWTWNCFNSGFGNHILH